MIKDKVAILGGGQLGKMICQAGSKLNLDLACLDPNPNAPASQVCPNFITGDFNDFDDVLAFSQGKDIITIEIENVETEALKSMESDGKRVYPQAKIIELIKDKGLQKQFYERQDIPSSNFSLFESAETIRQKVKGGALNLPFVQKLRTGGYDGRGVQIIRNESDLERLFDAPSVVEDLVDIDKELSIIVARNPSADVKTYPLVEMEFNTTANLVEFLICPSRVDTSIHHKAKSIAIALAEALEIVGILAVEMFLDKSGRILVNESAPRTHNSGHHTIEACKCSQFEQQLRAIMNLPLGSTELNKPAVMINLLGEEGYEGPAVYENLEAILAMDDVYPHIYGKAITKPFRKMGHITILGNDLDKAIQKARLVKDQIRVIT